jgi:hypothetical protein
MVVARALIRSCQVVRRAATTGGSTAGGKKSWLVSLASASAAVALLTIVDDEDNNNNTVRTGCEFFHTQSHQLLLSSRQCLPVVLHFFVDSPKTRMAKIKRMAIYQ